MSEEIKKSALYQQVKESEKISQGDILFSFPVFFPDSDSLKSLKKVTKESLGTEMAFTVYNADIIILSQSCDLVLDPARNRYPVDPVICAAINDIGKFSWDLVSKTNSGMKPSYYLLNKDNLFLDNSYIIDFGQIFTIPYDLLSLFSQGYGDRFRPISPILEKISQSFGNYFSRIGTEYERDKSDLKQEHEPLRKKNDDFLKQLKQEEYLEQQQLKKQKKQ